MRNNNGIKTQSTRMFFLMFFHLKTVRIIEKTKTAIKVISFDNRNWDKIKKLKNKTENSVAKSALKTLETKAKKLSLTDR